MDIMTFYYVFLFDKCPNCFHNRGFKVFFDSSLIGYIDDILVYPNRKKEHKAHLRTVLRLLKEKKLYAMY